MNDLQLVSTEALLDIARDLVVQPSFDADVVLELLATISTDDLDHQTIGAITHARLVMAAEPKSAAQVVTARFALARVVTLLEALVEGGSSAQLKVGVTKRY